MAIKKAEKMNRPLRVGQAFLHIFFIVFCLSIIAPLVLTLIVSFSSELSVLQYGYSFFPSGWSLEAYQFVFRDGSILQAYWVTIRVTLIGTFISVLLTSLCGFTISNGKLKYRNAIAFFFYFPTVIGGGLIAWYYNIAYILNMRNTFWVLVLPSLINAFNLFMVRNYYKSIPESLVEAAEMDGARPVVIFLKIMFPLAVPITATISLFVSLGYWNDWYLASWFISVDRQDLYPLQFHLYKLWEKLTSTDVTTGSAPTETIYVATMFVTMGPIVLIYPFVQKYFIKGIMMGAVKS